MRSIMTHQFSQVPHANIPRSSFDRSHGFKATFDSGWLVPIYCDEALPGDSFNLKLTTFARLSTPLHPVMDNMFCDVFFFFVPNRLIWSHFVNFFGEQANPTDTTSYLVPTATSPAGGYAFGSLQDYFGLPPNGGGLSAPFTHNNLHARAYNLIWNQWFRDQNLQNSVVVDTGDGPDNPANYVLKRRNKRFDYFTSCLPWPQKGPSVVIPIGASAPVKTQAGALFTGVQPAVNFTNSVTGGSPAGVVSLGIAAGGQVGSSTPVSTAVSGGYYPNNLYADLSTATAATINQLRQAFQVQKIYERDARGGTRYTELIQSHFGVTSPDARLQRAEFLGGGSTRINVNPIAQTASSGITGSTTPQGNLAGIGTMSHSGVGFTKSFTEHGVLLGMLSVRADLSYQQGLDRMYSRSSRFDYYWPALAQIGEQAVLNQEICLTGAVADTAVFGYQERYAEYRYKRSHIAGQFRSWFAQPLDSWHLSQFFAGNVAPTLSDTFIQENPPIARIVAVPSQPQFLLDCYFDLRCARPMPVYGVPGLIDHF